MKKFTIGILTTLLLLLFISVHVNAGTRTSTPSKNTTTIAATKTIESAEARVLLTRLDEIKAMDKSMLSSSDRRVLRKEVRSIKSQLGDLGGGVYLSVGGILLIILLLIILL